MESVINAIPGKSEVHEARHFTKEQINESFDMSEIEPVGYQYRFKHGDWTSWINVPMDLEDFKRTQRDSLAKGTVEMRPIYAGDQIENLRSQLVKARAQAIEEANQLVGALWSDLFNKDLVKADGAYYFDHWRDRIKALAKTDD